jgi:hypothetical protein
MNKHLTSKHIIIAAAVAALALAGCGATLASTMRAPAPVDHVSELYGRLLVRTELPGFTSWNCPLVETDARRWSQGSLSAVDGFAAGLKQTSHSDSPGIDAAASVAWFGSAAGASSALDSEIAAARLEPRAYTEFTVPGIPGARGFTLSDGRTTRHNVAFTDGRYLHLVSVGFSSKVVQQPSQAQVVAAATALYQRVHEEPRPNPLTEKPSQFLR